MIPNNLKTHLSKDEPVYGMLTPIYDPSVVEITARLGFDLYMMDCEHGAGGPLQVEHLVRTCEAVGMTPMARVRSTDTKLILQFMDAGVMGVMMPGIMDADDVKRLVEAVKYPPLGRRGIAPVRANDYLLGTTQAEYLDFANRNTMVLPQIETMEAVNNLDSLLRVEGIDGFIVGPRDLSVAMGFRDGPGHEEVRSLVTEKFDKVRGVGLVVGTTAQTSEDAQDIVARGARIVLGSVNGLLKLGAAQFLQGARR